MKYSHYSKQSGVKYGIAFILFLLLFLSALYGCSSLREAGSPPAESNRGTVAAGNATVAFVPDNTIINSVPGQMSGQQIQKAGISLYPGYMELARNSKVKLATISTPAGIMMNKLQWKSENPEVAGVSPDGIVTAKKAGNTIVCVRLTGSEGEMASCAIKVKEDGTTLLYARKPQIPSGSQSTEEADNTETEEQGNIGADAKIPVEYDKSPDSPVEAKPSQDEFVWTITIDDDFVKTLESGLGNIKATYHLNMTAEKNGGTAVGQYKCTALQDIILDTSDLDRKIEQDTSGTVHSDNSMKSEVKDCTFEVTNYTSGGDYSTYGMKKGDLPTMAPLTPHLMMALGKFTFSTNASLSKSISTEDGTGAGSDSVNRVNHTVPFKIGIANDGSVELIMMGEGKNGQMNFKGYITKRPVSP